MERSRIESQLRELHQDAFGWAAACCGRDVERAGDVLQISYCRVLGGAADFRGESSLRSFLFGVIRHVALEERQRSHRERDARERLRQLPQAEASQEVPGEELAREERCAELAAALALLSQRQSEVLHLVFYQGLSLDQAARVMGVRPGSARRHYDRGKRALKSLLSSPAKTQP